MAQKIDVNVNSTGILGIYGQNRRGKGPWKGVLGEGRARRKEPVIVVKKNDVHVHHFWVLGISGQSWPKQASSVGKQAVLGVSCKRSGGSKKAILMDMDGHVNVH